MASTQFSPAATPPETNMMMGPKTVNSSVEITKISMSGAKMEWTTAGIHFLSRGSILDASHAPTMIGKIE